MDAHRRTARTLPATVGESLRDRLPSATYEGLDELDEAAARAGERASGWLGRIDAGLLAALGLLESRPRLAGLLLPETDLDEITSECARRLEGALGKVLECSRREVIIGAELWPSSALIAELVTLGVLARVRARMLAGASEPRLVELAPSLMTHVVEPYLGRGAEKADGPPSRRHASPGASRAEPVPIRAHPRTIAALRVIAASPGCSGGAVAHATGVKDGSNHISTLLKRLFERGLIEDANPGRVAGQPGAWVMTPYGRRILALLAGEGSVALSRNRRPSSEGGGNLAPRFASQRPPLAEAEQPGV